MRLFRMRKNALVSLMFIGTLIAVLTSVGSVHATSIGLVKLHHPPSTFTDPSDTYDGYLIGQNVIWTITLNATTPTAPFSWLSISNLTITDTLPNLGAGTPTALFVTYVPNSQNSSSALGPATFHDLGNGTLLWDFGQGPFINGTQAAQPYSIPDDYYTASITFNATINSNVLNNTYLTNTGVAIYTETGSGVHSSPSISDTIWAPSQVTPPPPPPTGGYLQPVDKLMFLFATIEDILVSNYWVELPAVGAIAALIIFKRRRHN